MNEPGLRVLVTGAGGFIGRHVLAAAPPTWSTVALSRTPLPARPGLISVIWDGNAESRLPTELEVPFDAVIHLAGNANHGLAMSEPWRDLVATGGLTAFVLSRVVTRRIVLLSSAAVYAGLEGRVAPGLCLEPPMAYGLSKRYVEGFASSLKARGRIESLVTFRLYNAFGPGERPTRLIPRVVESIRAKGPFRLSADPTSLSDPVRVEWVAQALIAAASGDVGGTFDLCGGEPVAIVEQVARIADALGARPPEITIDQDSNEVPIRFWSDVAPAVMAFGLAQPGPFRDAVQGYAREMGWR